MKPTLPAIAPLDRSVRSRLIDDFERHAEAPLGPYLREWALEQFGVDIAGRYAGRLIRVPFGKGSGQLSMTPQHAETDAQAGLGFVVLKTVIAQDSRGEQMMGAWAIPESHMRVERIADVDGAEGWTVTWHGRGWDKPFSSYLRLLRAVLPVGGEHEMPIAASVKYHLPGSDTEAFAVDEYRYTTQAIAAAWRDADGVGAPIIEKDFSPTLAGDARSEHQSTVRRWLREVPRLIQSAGAGRIDLGLKLMNARFDDAFQVDMLGVLDATPGVAFRIAFNRLFDEARGVAYGGPALSRRNLRVLDAYLGERGRPPEMLSATGDIHSGRRMVEYALRGAQSGQMHTYFQLPRSTYRSGAASRTAAALHELVLHPDHGLIAWMLALEPLGLLERRDGVLHFLDIRAMAASAT